MTSQSNQCCVLLLSNTKELHQNLIALVGGENPVEETQTILPNGKVTELLTTEIELESKYGFSRVRIIASDDLHTLLHEESLNSSYQLPPGANVPPVCSVIVGHHSVEANNSTLSSCSELKNGILSLLEKWNPDSRILMFSPHFSSFCFDSSLTQQNEFSRWCVQNEIEIVDFEPEEPLDCNTDTDASKELEEYGIKRIMAALQVAAACVSTQRDGFGDGAPQFEKLSSDESESSMSGDEVEEKTLGNGAISGSLPNPEDVEQFDSLFARLTTMKETCQAMPMGSERLNYAEKVVSAFWNAIGGDSDDLDSSSSCASSSDAENEIRHNNDDGLSDHLVEDDAKFASEDEEKEENEEGKQSTE